MRSSKRQLSTAENWAYYDLSGSYTTRDCAGWERGAKWPVKTTWSLYDMLKFHAAVFLTAFVQLEMTLSKYLLEQDEEVIRKDGWKCIVDLRQECVRVGLDSSVNQIDRIERWFKNPETLVGQLVVLISDLRGNIQQELVKKKCFLLQPAEIRFYDQSFIETVVKDKFPSTLNDLSESGKCIALDRPTASVFHSMRALEVGLECLVKALDVTIVNPNWENVINDCQSAIKNLHLATPRSLTWKEDQQFYSECATEFRYFKDAWRNHVMHRRADYGSGQALDIVQSVQRFLVHLSERLDETTI